MSRVCCVVRLSGIRVENRRQLLAINFSTDRTRDRFDARNKCGHHVRGQFQRDERAQIFDIELGSWRGQRRFVARHHMRDQFALRAFAFDGACCFAH